MVRYIRSSNSDIDGYWYLSRHGVGPGCWPRGVNMLEYKEHPQNAWKCYVKLDRMLTTQELKDFDLKEEIPEDVQGCSTVTAADSDEFFDEFDLKDIKNAVSNAVKDYMCGPEGGFDEVRDPDDKYSMPWTDYAQIEVNDAGDGWVEVRVNAELGYESFENMFEAGLNAAVERFDPEAYFDMEDSGRAVAMINLGA